MELHLKAKKSKEIFSKFQSLLQVAKSGIISRNTAARKISKFQKKFPLNNQFEVDCTIKFNLYLELAYQM